MIEIAGFAFSAIGLAHTLGTGFKDWIDWEYDALLVDGAWLPLALKKGILEGKPEDYSWPQERRVATLQLAGTHDVVMAVIDKRRIKFRIVQGEGVTRTVLMKKIEG